MSEMNYQKQILNAFWDGTVNEGLYWIAKELSLHGAVLENSKLVLMLPLSNFFDTKLKLELQFL